MHFRRLKVVALYVIHFIAKSSGASEPEAEPEVLVRACLHHFTTATSLECKVPFRNRLSMEPYGQHHYICTSDICVEWGVTMAQNKAQQLLVAAAQLDAHAMEASRCRCLGRGRRFGKSCRAFSGVFAERVLTRSRDHMEGWYAEAGC